MKLIEPSVELIEQEPGIEGIYKQIERCARVCYKSEDKITEDSAKKFVDMLIKNGHGAMLEHGTVYLKFPDNTDYINLSVRYNSNPYSTIKWDKLIGKYASAYVTTNYRVLVENEWLDDLKYICEPTQYHNKRYTLKFITSIGITRELIRHRHFSFANESTRYCNYSKNRFGNELSFVKSYWMDKLNLEDPTDETVNILKAIEKFYIVNTYLGLPAQQIREVLPLCTKSEIIMTGFEFDWKDFFKLRCDKAAHPDMQIIANKAKELLKL